MLVYDTLEQARMRLRHSVLTYCGQAVYVRDVRDGRGAKPMMVDVTIYPLYDSTGNAVEETKGSKLSIPINDPDLNFRLFNVGYFNDPLDKRAEFLTRMTQRQQTQGLMPRSLANATGRINEVSAYSKEFEDMLFERYPTPKEAFKMITNDNWSSVAISSVLAVGRDRDHRKLYKLYYRGQSIGLALGTDFTSFLVDDEYTYLKEVLQQEDIPFSFETVE